LFKAKIVPKLKAAVIAIFSKQVSKLYTISCFEYGYSLSFRKTKMPDYLREQPRALTQNFKPEKSDYCISSIRRMCEIVLILL
jgi:hypothetical protein